MKQEHNEGDCPLVDQRDCPLQKIIPADVIKEWVHELNEMKDDVKMIKRDTHKPRTSVSNWIAVSITVIIFASSVVYSAGIQRNQIMKNESDIVRVSQKLELVESKTAQTMNDIIKETQANRELLIELKTMAQDVREIKAVIFKQLRGNE